MCSYMCMGTAVLLPVTEQVQQEPYLFKYLARKDAHEVASIGTGNQARMQLRAAVNVADIRKVHAWDSIEEML